jgi:hypothetical protein
MNATTREVVRRTIIRLISAARQYGVDKDFLRSQVRAPGPIPEDDLLSEVDYLVSAGFIELVPKAISPENKRWKITKAGRDYAAEEGLDG